MNTHIKVSNIKEIDKHIKDVFSSKITENKLFALLKLVDKKGTAIEAPEDEFLNGIKVIEYKKGYYIGFIKNVYKNGSFRLKTISLKA
jgi:hypothetical protein